MSRLCRGAARLLTVLWAVAAVSSADQPQSAVSSDQQGGSGDALDQLLLLVGQAVRAATDPIVSELSSQRALLDEVDKKLNGRQDTRLDSLNLRLDSLTSRVDSIGSQLDSWMTLLGSPMDSLDSKFGRRLEAVNTRLSSLPADLVSCARPEASHLPRDCGDLPAGARSGVHLVRPGLNLSEPPVEAFCDMGTDGGGWLVFQRRADILPRQNFYRNWTEYRDGFGQLDAEFWWGLEKLWLVTAPLDRRYELRVDLEDFEGERRYAVYKDFRISSETDGYRITGGNYSGDAGDSLSSHLGQKFSTKDRDLDNGGDHCAQERKGAWWYHHCHVSNLNGKYLSGKTPDNVYGVNWKAWRGYHYSLKTVEMKIRPITKSV